MSEVQLSSTDQHAHDLGKHDHQQEDEPDKAIPFSVIVNRPVGTSSGNAMNLFRAGEIPPTRLDTFLGTRGDNQVIIGLRLTFPSAPTTLNGGVTTGAISGTFNFRTGDLITEFILRGGTLVDRIEIRTRSGGAFTSGGSGGINQPQIVGNGIFLGFEGTSSVSGVESVAARFQLWILLFQTIKYDRVRFVNLDRLLRLITERQVPNRFAVMMEIQSFSMFSEYEWMKVLYSMVPDGILSLNFLFIF